MIRFEQVLACLGWIFLLAIPEAAVGELRMGIGRMSRMLLPSADGVCQRLTLPLVHFLFQSPSLGGKKQRAQLLTPDP